MSKTINLFVILSGFASLSWEVIWQIKSALALGVSAWGAAMTLTVIMMGMCLGGLWMGRVLTKKPAMRALRIYALLEITAGVAGLLLNVAFSALENFDSMIYHGIPSAAPFIQLAGIVVILGLPALCMGASFPVFALMAQQYNLNIANLYGLNTLGAAVGVLVAALVLLPLSGITHTIWIIAAINITLGLIAMILPVTSTSTSAPCVDEKENPISFTELLIISVSGFAAFTLEIAWFRSLYAVFPNTADIFSIMLACILIALWLAARKVRHKPGCLGSQLSLAGMLILLVTPLVERFDKVAHASGHSTNLGWLLNADNYNLNTLALVLYVFKLLIIFSVVCVLIVPPLRLLGTAFPSIINRKRSTQQIGRLYAINTFFAIIGSMGAAWILLPGLGFAKLAWLAGVLVMMTGMLVTPGIKRYLWFFPGLAALLIAIHFETGIGTARIQGYFANMEAQPARVLESHEGPDATVSAVEYADGARALLINSAMAAAEAGKTMQTGTHYMAWMGHLPMLLHDNPRNALVICFGSGQTANAVRKENPQSLDVVDVNPQIFQLAHYFRSNESVLEDKRVTVRIMDGRAWLRRTAKNYDVITLEPMPPVTVGVNALYSKEFYQLARQRLAPGGIIAQWLPFHAVAPHYAASIARTFIDVFPNAVLWIDPVSKNGILLGAKDQRLQLASAWPGFARQSIDRNLDEQEVRVNVALDAEGLKRYGAYGEVITDDNQLLAYGKALFVYAGMLRENFGLLHKVDGRIHEPG